MSVLSPGCGDPTDMGVLGKGMSVWVWVWVGAWVWLDSQSRLPGRGGLWKLMESKAESIATEEQG